MKKYIIEVNTYCDGWIHTCTDDDIYPVSFDTLQDAEQELALYLMELGIDADLGNIVDYNPEDFRITEISE
jgi:thymidylate synthase